MAVRDREEGDAGGAAGVADGFSAAPDGRRPARFSSCQHLSRAKRSRREKSIVLDVASAGVIFSGADSLTQAVYALSSWAVSVETSVSIVSRF